MRCEITGARRGDAAMMAVATTGTYALFLLVAFSFAVLTYGYVVSDFSVQNVYQNSHSLKPMIYKVSGVWGNHEGSMALWCLVTIGFGAIAAATMNTGRQVFEARAFKQKMRAKHG